MSKRLLDRSHTQPVASIDEGRASLKLLDKISEEAMVLLVVQLLYASFGDDAAVVGLDGMSYYPSENRTLFTG